MISPGSLSVVARNWSTSGLEAGTSGSPSDQPCSIAVLDGALRLVGVGGAGGGGWGRGAERRHSAAVPGCVSNATTSSSTWAARALTWSCSSTATGCAVTAYR